MSIIWKNYEFIWWQFHWKMKQPEDVKTVRRTIFLFFFCLLAELCFMSAAQAISSWTACVVVLQVQLSHLSFFYNITKSSSKISININKGMLITKQVICSLVAPIDHVYGSLGIVKASSTQKYADISKVRPEIEGSGSFTFFAPSNEAWELLDEVI